MLDKNVARILPFEPLLSFSEMYRTLMALQRQDWMPVSAVKLLWDTKDRHETMRILEGLVNANLAQPEYRTVDWTMTDGILLHDLHLSFAQDFCNEQGDSEKWHRKLLGKYLPEKDSSGNQTAVASRNKWYRKLLDSCVPCISKHGASDQSVDGMTSALCRNWWKHDVFADEYILNNVSRHQLGAGLGRELHSMLRHTKWAA